jgi:hypothetical protein
VSLLTAYSFVINRMDRPERLRQFRAAWGNAPELLLAFTPETFSSIPAAAVERGYAGWYAGMHSHMACIKLAKERGWPFVTIFEDDALPTAFLAEQYARFMAMVPNRWDVINYGGCWTKMPRSVGGPVFRAWDHHLLECYRVHERFYDVFIHAYKTAIGDGNWFENGSIWQKVQHVGACYAALNGMVYQPRTGKSDQTKTDAWKNDAWSPIPGWFSDAEGRAYAEEMRKSGSKRHVEVGVYCGRSYSFIADLMREGKVWLVDLWEMPGVRKNTSWESGGKRGKYEKGRKDFEWYLWKMGMWKHPSVEVMQGDSQVVAQSFGDGLLDSVFIDAAHDYASVKGDLEAWVPKVRKGGIVCGHDYTTKAWPGVVRAVNERFGKPDRVVDTFWCVEVK